MLEFADNNAVSKATYMTPFFFNTRHHPRISFSPTSVEYTLMREKLLVVKADDIASKMEEILWIGR